jgi:hypothetical protein
VVVIGALALFLTVFALLVFQLRSGRDPSLGRAVAAARGTAPRPRRVLVRKLIVTRVVVHLPRGDVVVPVVRSAAVPVPPPPAAAAPAPTPLTTHSS